jgi:hypothetical protein
MMDNVYLSKDRLPGIISRIAAILSVFFITWVVSSCSPGAMATGTATLTESPLTATFSSTPTANETQAPSQTPTWTRTLTHTLPLSPTQTPTATKFPGMQAGGPFIVVDYENWDRVSLTFLDIKGSTHWTVELPQWKENRSVTWDRNPISPNWNWYTYVTGTVNGGGTYPEGGVVLHLMNLLTGEVRDIASLVPQDYFARQERMVKQSDLEWCNHDPANCLSIAVSSLNASLYSMAWSPDGKHLAFGAMLDGDSADIYLYDIDTGKIRRLEEGSWNAHSFHWSPDGQWILYKDIDIPAKDFTTGVGDWPYSRWAIRRDGTGVKNLHDTLQFYTWFSDYEYVAWLFYPERSYSDPTAVNLVNGNIYNFFKGSIWGVSVGRRSRLVLVSDDYRRQYYFGEMYKKLTPLPFCTEFEEQCWAILREGTLHSIIYFNEGHWFGINYQGEIVSLTFEGGNYPRISPGNWLAFYSKTGFYIYDLSDKFRYSLKNLSNVLRMEWDTNSQGIYYIDKVDSGDAIYYWRLGDPDSTSIAILPNDYKLGDIFYASIINLQSLPHLRILPTRAAKPAEGTSIWSRTTYKQLFQPGTNHYNVTIPADSSWRWSFSLGTTDSNLFEEILLPEDVEFLINGERIDSNMFRMSDQTLEGKFSRAWAATLSGWRSGDRAELEIHYTLHSAVSDGNVVYPPGEYRQIISLVVE